MTSSLESLASSRYDLLVVGGGIHGLFAAYDAAGRGLSVALVDRADFGGGVSFNHQRTIHGGLRALQHGNLRKTSRQIAERRAWAHMAPQLLRPLPFLVGTYRWTKRSRAMFKAGFAVYDAIGRHRNTDISPELHLPKARLESFAATRRLFPGIAETGLSGGAIWYDYQIIHPDRLTWTVALAARGAGARLANHVEAVAGRTSTGSGHLVRVRDVLTGAEAELETSAVLLAAGPSLGDAMRAFGVSGAPPLLRAMNMLLDRPARDIALVAPGASGRMLTAVPWRGFVLVGTHQSDALVESPETVPPPESLTAFLGEANAAFPRLAVAAQDVRLVHHGLVPASVDRGRVDLLSESRVIRHPERPALFSLVGVKYTTARAAAAEAIDAVTGALGGRRGRSHTQLSALPHAGVADVEGRLIETLRGLGVSLDRQIVTHLATWYGTEASDVARFSVEAGLLTPLGADPPVLEGEIAYAAARQDARRLADATLRRTPLGSAGHPGRQALERSAAIMGTVLDWTDARRAAEVADVEARYPNPNR